MVTKEVPFTPVSTYQVVERRGADEHERAQSHAEHLVRDGALEEVDEVYDAVERGEDPFDDAADCSDVLARAQQIHP